MCDLWYLVKTPTKSDKNGAGSKESKKEHGSEDKQGSRKLKRIQNHNGNKGSQWVHEEEGETAQGEQSDRIPRKSQWIPILNPRYAD